MENRIFRCRPLFACIGNAATDRFQFDNTTLIDWPDGFRMTSGIQAGFLQSSSAKKARRTVVQEPWTFGKWIFILPALN